MTALGSRDLALALLVAVLWGFTFVATRIALDSFSPAQLTALRFLIAAIPALFLPRPRIAWPLFLGIGLTLFTGQFLFQFFGMASGLPPGLTSVVVQTQAFFTVLFAAWLLGERPTRRQQTGMAAALVGIVLIALTIGQNLTAAGLAFGVASALSWAIGNVLLKRMGAVDMLGLVVWVSLVPPLPSLALSSWLDGPGSLVRALPAASWSSLAAALYIGMVATTLGYAIWGDLLRRYPAVAVAPFALLVPFVGALASAIVFGERFGQFRLAGMAFVLLGLVLIVFPARVAPRPIAD